MNSGNNGWIKATSSLYTVTPNKYHTPKNYIRKKMKMKYCSWIQTRFPSLQFCILEEFADKGTQSKQHAGTWQDGMVSAVELFQLVLRHVHENAFSAYVVDRLAERGVVYLLVIISWAPYSQSRIWKKGSILIIFLKVLLAPISECYKPVTIFSKDDATRLTEVQCVLPTGGIPSF